MTLLEVRDLQTQFRTRRGVARSVDRVSFTLERGMTLGLVGESGSGKSMTCLSILGLVPEPGQVVGGSVRLEGEELVGLPRRAMRRILGSRIATILQDPMTSLNPAYSVGEQVAEVFRIHRKLRGETLREAVRRTLERVRIPSAAARMRDYPHMMSGGMRQRVVAATAIACGPSLLIADEPTTALDVTTQAAFLDMLKALQAESGLGIIFVTHDFGIVRRICDRVAVMYAGRIAETGTTEEIFTRPRHPYTRALPAAVPDID